MDQIFDRFERMFKSWVAGAAEDLGERVRRGTSDPDFDAAMDELDDFLNSDRTATQERERREEAERARRERESRSDRGAYGGSSGTGWRPAGGPSGPHPKLVAAYRTLGLSYGAPFPQVKSAYKKLLMQNHPDRNSATPAQLKRSTEISAQINAAYGRIETWVNSGVVTED
ncbi:MAG TPA: J domain-containing protein [Rectinemataceae bacterium]|nr:J domain-containing protein [Rectinemataceae bacterium]